MSLTMPKRLSSSLDKRSHARFGSPHCRDNLFSRVVQRFSHSLVGEPCCHRQNLLVRSIGLCDLALELLDFVHAGGIDCFVGSTNIPRCQCSLVMRSWQLSPNGFTTLMPTCLMMRDGKPTGAHGHASVDFKQDHPKRCIHHFCHYTTNTHLPIQDGNMALTLCNTFLFGFAIVSAPARCGLRIVHRCNVLQSLHFQIEQKRNYSSTDLFESMHFGFPGFDVRDGDIFFVIE